VSPLYRAQVSQQTLTVQPALPNYWYILQRLGLRTLVLADRLHLLGQLLPFRPNLFGAVDEFRHVDLEAGDRRDTVLEQDARGFGVGELRAALDDEAETTVVFLCGAVDERPVGPVMTPSSDGIAMSAASSRSPPLPVAIP